MAKAILVIDMPNDCIHCPLDDGEYGFCNVVDKPHSDDISRKRESWCPLKPIPQKKKHFCETDNPLDDEDEDEYEYWYREGYNRCIDEILGD